MLVHGANAERMHQRHVKAPPGSTPLNLMLMGVSNTGKTEAIRRHYGSDVYEFPYNCTGNQWVWTGLDPERHRVLLFDEFEGQVPAGILSRWLQKGPIQCRMPGANIIWWQPEVIAFCCHDFPQDWGHAWTKQTRHDVESIARRLHYVAPYVRSYLPNRDKQDYWDRWLWNAIELSVDRSRLDEMQGDNDPQELVDSWTEQRLDVNLLPAPPL